MNSIHTTAIIEDGAIIGENVSIGPYCHIGPRVKLGDNVDIRSHAVVAGKTQIGDGVKIFQFAAVGTEPQDMKYHGEDSEAIIGAGTIIREHVTVHPGTEGGGSITRVGENCLLMVGCHVAHDCILDNNVIIVNNVLLGGHVEVGEFTVVGGQSAIHQFVHIGKHAMIGGATGIVSDVIPYGTATGNRADLSGLNLVGLRRRGFPRDEIHGLRAAYKELFGSGGLIDDRLQALRENYPGNPLVQDVIEFIAKDTSRALCQPKSGSD